MTRLLKIRKSSLALFTCALFFTTASKGQNLALKTNLLYDATATLNLGLEVGVAPKWTLDVSANYNPFTFAHARRWKHWLVQPEVRHWFCDRFSGHFVGVHALGGQYNVGHLKNDIKLLGMDLSTLSHHRYQGWFVGGGLAYGYSWILNRHWNLEAEIGVGYVYRKYDKFQCAGCGKRLKKGETRHYLGPTKAAVNLVYHF